MSEKRKIQRFNLDEGKIWEAIEGLSPFKTTYTLEEVCEKLNEQQDKISELEEELEESSAFIIEQRKENKTLKEENEQLKKYLKIHNESELSSIDYNLKLYEENRQLEKGKMEALSLLGEEIDKNEQLRTQLLICQQSKNDDGRFQVWEVPPIPKGKRISFTTNNDGDGV